MSLADRFRHPLGAGVPAVSAPEARAWISEGALLLDVREDGEWQAGHAPQARHVSLGRLLQALPSLPTDRRIVVVCRSGNRSRTAAKFLGQSGREAVNLTGGMRAWQAAGLPLVGRGGRPGTVI
jgi:rhodanese-related sulfurtransferase